MLFWRVNGAVEIQTNSPGYRAEPLQVSLSGYYKHFGRNSQALFVETVPDMMLFQDHLAGVWCFDLSKTPSLSRFSS